MSNPYINLVKTIGKSSMTGTAIGAGLSAMKLDPEKQTGNASMDGLETFDTLGAGASAGLLGGYIVGAAKGLNTLRKYDAPSKVTGLKNLIKKVAYENFEMEKQAKFSKRMLKSTLFGAGIGATLSAAHADSVAENNPHLSEEGDASKYIKSKALQGGALAGLGTYQLSKMPSRIGKKMIKAANISVPEKEELDEAEKEVRDSPNKDEIKEMAESITEESIERNKYKDLIEKMATISVDGYLKPINCEVCGYTGLPRNTTGACPECGALGGMDRTVSYTSEKDDYSSKERNLTTVFDMAQQSLNERLSYYR